MVVETPPDVKNVVNFITMRKEELETLRTDLGLAMRYEDVLFANLISR